ncbi:MAG: hypothetical protein ACR2NP_22630 [Pirellulaceae bacterium]
MTNPPKKQAIPVISANRTTDHGSSRTIPCGEHDPIETASVEVIREGNMVREIHVHCSCGENMKVICTYE